MLTRLKVRGFKNLVDVDVRFGPFTCVAGPNGVGKSNLFDAILFLSELADKPFVEAARNVRGGDRPEDRKEMRNWRLLQLEPSAMREADDFQSEDWMTVSGAHIPATLYRIASSPADSEHEGRIYATTANRLAELVDGVRTIRVDRDDTRQALILMMTDRYGLELPASALSDGTMRFIALTVLQQDPSETGVICLEEPENGIHPERIGAMLRLLNDIAVDVESAVGDENPLRQIIINTHSPIVAKLVGEGDLLFASMRSRRVDRRRIPELGLACLDSTWRSESGMETIPIGKVLAYLQGVTNSEGEDEKSQLRRRRVMDRFHPGQLDIAFP